VVEVGPGPGGLTRALFLEGAERVSGVERDERCRPRLEAIAERYPGRLAVRYGERLPPLGRACRRRSEQADHRRQPALQRRHHLLIGWLESEPWPPWYARMVLMFQREVAERIVARPASKAYGRLAVIAQWRTRPRLLFTVKPEAFTPPPSVASAIVEFTPIDRPRPECRVQTLGAVTAAAFGQRRKMLRQSLRR
jgi:16S rRNA (adenine1518-N6/adenine1519-N6)-dimethyltransferase